MVTGRQIDAGTAADASHNSKDTSSFQLKLPTPRELYIDEPDYGPTTMQATIKRQDTYQSQNTTAAKRKRAHSEISQNFHNSNEVTTLQKMNPWSALTTKFKVEPTLTSSAKSGIHHSASVAKPVVAAREHQVKAMKSAVVAAEPAGTANSVTDQDATTALKLGNHATTTATANYSYGQAVYRQSTRDESTSTGALCSQSVRRAYLKQACASVAHKPTWQLPDLGPHVKNRHTMPKHRFYVNHAKKLVYCQLSKVACTTWTDLMSAANLNGSLAVFPMQAHLAPRLRKANVTFHEQLPLRFRNYTKFLVVRNPFDRLLSAYYNIIHPPANQLGPGPAVIKALTHKFKTPRSKITLHQFVDFLTSHEPITAELLYDRHYGTYAHACGVCKIQYDYVIRHEAMSEDAKIVLRRLGFKSDHFKQAEKIHPGNRRNYIFGLGEQYLYEFNKVPKSKLKKLYTRYSVDMQLFGYGFDQDLKITSCRVPLPNGKTCC